MYILTYGSEVTEVCAALNVTNSNMVNVITGRSVRKEATEGKRFDFVKWIRSRKLQWPGHILRMG